MHRKTDQAAPFFPLSRREFLGGLGGVAITSVAVSPLDAVVCDRLQPYGQGPIDDRELSETAEKTVSAGLRFTDVFAPAENLVKSVEKPYRQDMCLNGAWEFQPVSLLPSFQSGMDSAPSLPPVEANRWEEKSVYVPSPWNVNSFADHHGEGGDFRSYPSYPAAWEQVGMGWLHKFFTVPLAWKGKRVFLHFDAVAGSVEIVVNGTRAGSHFDIFLPFDMDVTESIVFGGNNEVLVGVRKASVFDKKGEHGHRTYQGGSFWGQHIAGIWQDVFLVAVPLVRVCNVFILPKVDVDTLQAEVTLQNDSDQDVEISMNAQISRWLPNAGKTMPAALVPSSELGTEVVLELTKVILTIPAHGTANATLKVAVRNRLRLWDCANPNLYGLVVKIHRNGETVDSKYTRFGWRQIIFRGADVLLNGETLTLCGDSWHFMGIPQMTRRYRSVFNLVWYGLRPLPLGLADTSRPPTLEDGIFFSEHVEGRPGVQPQRLGPYCSTLNPGYDSSLPLYRTWPLFDAIHDASAESPDLARWGKLHVSAKPSAAMTVGSSPSVGLIAGSGSKLVAQLGNIGVLAPNLVTGSVPQLLFVDGAIPPDAGSSTLINEVLTSGGTVFVWGAAPSTLEALNVLLPARLELTDRAASSLVPVMPSAITVGLEPSGLYFCDQKPPDFTYLGLAGPLIDEGRALLAACNTDWLKWNNQPEYAKTAMVIRSEGEAKPSGVVLAEMPVGRGRLLLTSLSSTPMSVKAERIDRTVLANLGIALKAGMDSGKPLLRTCVLVRALACGFFSIPSVQPASEPWHDNNFRTGSAMAGHEMATGFRGVRSL